MKKCSLAELNRCRTINVVFLAQYVWWCSARITQKYIPDVAGRFRMFGNLVFCEALNSYNLPSGSADVPLLARTTSPKPRSRFRDYRQAAGELFFDVNKLALPIHAL